MFNFFIHIEPRELVVMDRVLAKASREIEETVDFLEADEVNCLNIRDICKARLMRNLDGLADTNGEYSLVTFSFKMNN